MSEPFLAEITIVAFNFAPRGFALCDGQILPINQNQSLFSLLGTTYGGDGRTTFALPELRGRTPVHPDGGIGLGQKGGEEGHTLTEAEIPPHTHAVNASNSRASSTNPTGNVLGNIRQRAYKATAPDTALRDETVANAGGGQAHNNMQPFLTVNFCIALQGLFPSRN